MSCRWRNIWRSSRRSDWDGGNNQMEISLIRSRLNVHCECSLFFFIKFLFRILFKYFIEFHVFKWGFNLFCINSCSRMYFIFLERKERICQYTLHPSPELLHTGLEGKSWRFESFVIWTRNQEWIFKVMNFLRIICRPWELNLLLNRSN